MTWYSAHYGTWRDAQGVQYIDGTYDRKEMFQKAQEIANDKHVAVTVVAEHGMHVTCHLVEPGK